MSRTIFRGAHALVEGPTDNRFWRTFFDETACQLVICGGKSNVKGALERLEALSIKLVLGIIDDDLDSQLGPVALTPNLFLTDDNDLECMLLRTDALELALNALGDPAKMTAYELAMGVTVRDAIIERALVFGRLRYVSISSGLNVRFAALSPWKYIPHQTWILDLITLLEDFSNLGGRTSGQVAGLLQAAPSTPEWSLINGHDAIDIITIALTGVFSDLGTNRDAVCSHLRIAYKASGHFANTKLFNGLIAWQADNARLFA